MNGSYKSRGVWWTGWFIACTILMISIPGSAGPGEGLKMGNATISPFVDLSATYDSNVKLKETEEEDDFFIDLMAGGAGLYQKGTLDVSMRLWYMFRNYFEITDYSHNEWGEKVVIRYGDREDIQWILNQKYRLTEDIDRSPSSSDFGNTESQQLILSEDRTMRVARRLHDIGVSAGRNLTDKTDLDLGYSFSDNNYVATNLNDWTENKILAEVAYKVSDKSWMLLNGQYGVHDSASLVESPELYILRLGVQTKNTDNLMLKSTAGMEHYTYTTTDNGYVVHDYDSFSFDVSGDWKMTEKVKFQLTARNGVQPTAEYDNNVMDIALASLSAEYQIREAWIFSLTGSYRYDQYREKEVLDGVLQELNSRQLAGHVRLNYDPPLRFYKAYIEVRYEDTDSTWTYYEQLRVTLGLSLRY